MEEAEAPKLPLITDLDQIGLERLKDFPFWISTPEMKTDWSYWDEVEPPEGVPGESWMEFPKDFLQQVLFDPDDEDLSFSTQDLIELAEKNNGILFVCEGWEEMQYRMLEYCYYPGVFAHLRFKSELDRMATIKNIRDKQKITTLFPGQYPAELEQVPWWKTRC